MRKTITTITLGLLFSLSTFATVLTVNNITTAPGSPGQYTTIDAAFAAAIAGDTILVKGSPTPYILTSSGGMLLINKKICIIGEGYKPKGDANFRTDVQGSFSFSSTAASGSSIWGLSGSSFSIGVTNANTIRLNNITIRRNQINIITLSDSTYNTTIAENFIYLNINFNVYNGTGMARHVNLKILNNVFTSNSFANPGNSYAYQVKNNLFINGSYSSPQSSNPTKLFGGGASSGYSRCQNAQFENNIFYNSIPAPSVVGDYGPTSCSFINNITFCAITNPLISTLTGNSFSGNLDNTDPAYANLFTNTTANRIVYYTDLYNIRISNSSPAKNAGSDGTDIGPTGGAYPIYAGVPLTEQLSGEPPLPQVRNANFTNNINAVQTGGTLQINVTGRKRN